MAELTFGHRCSNSRVHICTATECCCHPDSPSGLEGVFIQHQHLSALRPLQPLAEKNHLAQGHDSLQGQPASNIWPMQGYKSSASLPQLGPTLKGYPSFRIPCEVI